MITINCLACQKEHQVHKKEIARGNDKFCSKSCCYIFNRGKPKVARVAHKCANTKCGKEFFLTPASSKKRSGGKYLFCCRLCKDEGQKICNKLSDMWPSHYNAGGKISIQTACKSIVKSNCEDCGWDKHPEVLQIHHVDRDRTNNDLTNLRVVCPNCHCWDHFLGKDGLYSSLDSEWVKTRRGNNSNLPNPSEEAFC